MNAIKTTGFLRIWKAILFMMAVVCFIIGFKDTAWAVTKIYDKNSGSAYLEYTPKRIGWPMSFKGAVIGNGGRTWWGNCDYCTGGFGNGEFFGEQGTSQKSFLLTKDQVLKYKKGETQIAFPPGCYKTQSYRGAYLHKFSQRVTLYVAQGTGYKSYSFDTNRLWYIDPNYTYTHSIRETPTIPNGTKPLYTYNGIDYYGALVINVHFDFLDGRDPADGREGGNGRVLYMTAAKDDLIHSHNSSGVEYGQGNANQHVKYTYCNLHGSDHSQNRKSSNENHTWVETRSWYNYDNTTQRRDLKCSKCGRTKIESKTRLYSVDINVMSPEDKQMRPDGAYGYGYFKIKSNRHNTDWSEEITDNDTRTCNFQYGDKLYIQYTRPYYDYLEFKSISTTNNKGLESLGHNTWCYTVTDNKFSDFGTGGEIRIDMDYKHTSLILAPNKGYIDGSPNNVTLQTPMQYNTSIWNDISSKTPVRAGYTFTGWYDSTANGTMVYDAQGKCVRGTAYFDTNGNSLCTSNLTVYAHWTPAKYQIKYILFNGSAEKVIEYTIEDIVRIPNASLNGYDFIGWTMSCKNGSVGDGNKTISANVSVPTKDLVIKGLYGDLTLTANYTKSKANTDSGYNKTPDDDGSPDHITDTGGRKTPLVTDGGTKHNMFRVTKTLR